MKASKKELEIAKMIQEIIESEIQKEETNIYKDNWYWAKGEIENNLKEQKELLIESQKAGLKISQMHTEGYISALDWLLFTFNSYDIDENTETE